MPLSARCLATMPSYEVATVRPARSSMPLAVPGLPAKRKVERAKPSGRISSALAPESMSRSRPVRPMSRRPEET